MLLSKKKDLNKDLIDFKLQVVCFIIFLGVLVLWIRAFYIQIVWKDRLINKSRPQYWKRELVYGIRGSIFSADNELLANSVVLKSVFAIPKRIENREKVVRELSEILKLKIYSLKKKLNKKSNFVWIKRKISDKEAAKISSLSLKGIYLTEEIARVYPQKSMAGQLIGFVGTDNKGLEGLEKGLDKILSGSKRYLLVQRDGKGRVLYAPGELDKDISGEDVYLTIDARIQTICESALAKGVQKSGGRYGMALVVDVKTGNILAWAQYPFFNPNNFRRYPPLIWRDRIALDMFEPGSTMKPFVVAAAMTQKICDPKKIYYCENGKWRVEDVIIRDTHPHKWLTVSKIIRYSSNICIAKIGIELGADRLYAFLKKLRFGERTSLPLPGEAKGLLRDVSKWNRVDLVNISFGQGISVTALQLVRAYLALANHGVLRPLNLLLNKDADEDAVRVIPEDVSESILSMLRDVVEKDGTGTRARIPGIEIGGKTGTSQKIENGKYSREKYDAIFIGLYPALDPRYLAFVMVDEPKTNIYGGVVSAPIVKKIFQGIFPLDKLYNVKKETTPMELRPLEIPKIENKSNKPEKPSNIFQKFCNKDLSKVPSLKGLCLREVLVMLAKKHIVPEVRGSGPVVVKQYPKAGSPWKGKIVLWMGYDN